MKINTRFSTNKQILGICFTVFLSWFVSTGLFAQATPEFGAGQNLTLLSGTDGTEGARYLYSDVALNVNGTAQDVDAVVTIIEINNATLNTPIDTAIGLDGRFEPTITTTVAGGFVEWELLFVIADSASASDNGVPILIDSYTLEAIDVDGNEFFEVAVPDSYTLEGGNAGPPWY